MIEIEHLTKRYGEHLAVSNFSFTVDEVQAICNQIIMIAKGKLIAFDAAEIIIFPILVKGPPKSAAPGLPYQGKMFKRSEKVVKL